MNLKSKEILKIHLINLFMLINAKFNKVIKKTYSSNSSPYIYLKHCLRKLSFISNSKEKHWFISMQVPNFNPLMLIYANFIKVTKKKLIALIVALFYIKHCLRKLSFISNRKKNKSALIRVSKADGLVKDAHLLHLLFYFHLKMFKYLFSIKIAIYIARAYVIDLWQKPSSYNS